MKKFLGLTAALALGLGLSQSASAIAITEGPYYGTEVGDVDTLITTIRRINSGNAEAAWLQNLFPGATILPQEQNVHYYDTNMSGIYAFLVDPIADYFMIKNAQWHAVFQNNAENDWAVFNTALLPADMNLGGKRFTISHIRIIDVPTNVPEPATLSMLGLGLLGLGFARRRKQS